MAIAISGLVTGVCYVIWTMMLFDEWSHRQAMMKQKLELMRLQVALLRIEGNKIGGVVVNDSKDGESRWESTG